MPLSWGQAKGGRAGQVHSDSVAVARPICHDIAMKIPRPPRPVPVVVVLAVTAAVLSLASNGVSSVEDFLWEHLGVYPPSFDANLTTYLVAYGLGLVPGGYVAQRYGPRPVLAASVLGWSASVVLLTTARDFPTHLASRVLMGLSQGAALPAAVLLLTQSVPERRRGLANGVVAFAGRFAQVAAAVVTPSVIAAFVPLSTTATVTAGDISDDGQVMIHAVHAARFDEIPKSSPMAMVLLQIDARLRISNELPESWPDYQDMADAINAVIRDPGALDEAARLSRNLTFDARAILDLPVSERSVAQSERLNRLVVEANVGYPIPRLHIPGWRPAFQTYGLLGVIVAVAGWLVLRDRHAPRVTLDIPAAPWLAILTSRNQWLSCGVTFFSNYGRVLPILVMPWFLANRFRVPDKFDVMMAVPLFAGAFAMLAGGVATDWLTRRSGKRWGRSLPMGGLKLSSAAFLAVTAFLPEVWMFVAAVALAAMCHDFGTPAAWAFAQDTGGEQAGVVSAWSSLWGVVGAWIALAIEHGVVTKLGIDAAMLAAAAAYVLSAACGLMANATVALDGEPEA